MTRSEQFLHAATKLSSSRFGVGVDGIEVENRSASIWTLREGEVVNLATDLEPAEALEIAGLQEKHFELVPSEFIDVGDGSPATSPGQYPQAQDSA